MANPLTTSVGVGVIDTGIDASDGRHPEFVGVNFGETLPFNLKDLPPLKLQELFFDFLKSGHGTKVAGVIGANNISATSSINYKFPQMNGVLSGVRGLQYILEAQPLENLSFIEFGTIIDSFGENINVINMSISSNKCSEVSFIAQAQRQCVKDEDFSEAIAYYADGFNAHQDKLFVVGAANENKDVAFVSTPANLGFLNNVLTVGSTNLQDGRSSFSNFGFAVGIAAPGEHIYAPAIRGKGNFPISGDEAFNYVTDFSGTSASAPMVTRVAAILKSIKPELTPGEIKNILTRTADSLFVSSTSDEAGKLLGSGCSGVPLTGQVLRGCRLNALKAVKSALSPWIEISISNPPPAVDRHGYSAVYDQNTNHLIFFGGVSGTPSCCASFNDVWILTNANGIGGIPQWIQLFPFGSPPKGRSFHSAVYDQTNNRMIIFGGGQFNGNLFTPRFNDVWVLTNANGT
ncbi:MAG: S8 family serine peptidase [Candidatus Brennerbacteria bacterium]|nr:S8 family serine peptidase [Candidatus Brennerbacteria bacterium]